MSEKWKEIIGYEGMYEVSDMGRVRNVRTGRVLKPGTDEKGYKRAGLSRNGVGKTVKVHHLVLGAFVCLRPNGLVCNHKNGNKRDNRLENLEWVTPSENTQHGFDVLHRNTPRGDSHGMAVLDSGSVVKIYELYKTGRYSQHELAKMFGIGRSSIQRIISGATWRSVLNV